MSDEARDWAPLEKAYQQAFDEFIATSETALWDATVGDGLNDGS
jgi:hypothetical protein